MNTNHYIELQSRNVIDKYKDLPTEEIKKRLQETSFPYAVCFEHWVGDFNMSTGVRNANAFNAKEVFYLGPKRWDKRGAVGTNHYIDIINLPSINDLIKLKDKYKFVGVDNVPGSISLKDHKWEDNTLLIFGEEGVGLTKEVQDLCTTIVAIDMFGSVRSLNCGTASGIVMYDFTQKKAKYEIRDK